MTLTKKKGVYYANIRTPEGKTRSVSTRATTLDDAKRIAKEANIKNLELAARAGRLTNEVIGRLTTGRKLNLNRAVPQYVAWLANRREGRTLDNYSGTIRRWIADMQIGHLPPSMVNAEHVSAWINAETKAKASTRLLALSALRGLFKYCSIKGWCVGNPAAEATVHLSRLSHAQKEKTSRKPITELEYTKLLGSAEGAFWVFAIRAAWEHGWRLGDICRLEWECFTTEPGNVVLWTDKHDHRLPPAKLSKSLESLVTSIPVKHKQWLFPDALAVYSDGKRRSLLSVQFGRLCAKCGIKGKSFHSLRHAFARRQRQDGLSKEEIALKMGHSETITTDIYLGDSE